MMWGCSSEEPVFKADQPQDSHQVCDIRTPEEAMDIAESSYSNFFNTKSRSEISADKNVIAVPSQSFRNARSGNDTVIYIVNFENDKVFAIINALKVGEPLIGISDKGNYNMSDSNSNPPGLEMFIDDCVEISRNVRKKTLTPLDTTLRPIYEYQDLETVIDTLENSNIEPKVKAVWSQNGDFGKFCPNGKVGCGPLAIGAALTVYKPFTTIKLTFPNTPKKETLLDWDGMIKLGGLNPSLTNMDVAEMAALYLRQIGHLALADYDMSKAITGTSPNLLHSTTKYLCNSTNLEVSELSDNLKYTTVPRYYIKKGVVIIWGSTKDAPNFGHTWLADGYKYLSVKTTHYGVSLFGDKTFLDEFTIDSYYIHMNWGWGGTSNGYFNIKYMQDQLNPADPDIPDVAGQPNVDDEESQPYSGKYGYFYISEK